MIVDFLVQVLLGILGAVLSLVPEWDIDFPTAPCSPEWHGEFDTPCNQAAGFLRALDRAVPVDALINALLIAVAAAVALMVWHLAVFVWDKFPFKSA